MTTFKAAICRSHNTPLTIENITLRDPKMGEVAVKLDAVAICHSDITYIDGGFGGDLPAVYGHEAAGRITAVGGGVVGFEKGDHVLVTLIRACGYCPSCAGGKPTACETPKDPANSPITLSDGTRAVQGMSCGAFAEAVVVDQSQIVKIPAEMPKDVAALLSCGVITGVGAAIYAGGIKAGQDVVVIGAGGVGLNAIQGARVAGARRIVAVDMNQEKLDAAIEFGATDTVLGTSKKPWVPAMRAMGRGADAVLVTVGAIPAYDQAPRYLASGGKVVMIGMPHLFTEASYSPIIMADAGQGMIGSKMGDVVIQRDIPWMIDLYQQGRLKLDELISGRWTLDQINDAIADVKLGIARRNVILL